MTQSHFYHLLRPGAPPPQGLSLILISVWTLHCFHIISCQLSVSLFKLSLGARTKHPSWRQLCLSRPCPREKLWRAGNENNQHHFCCHWLQWHFKNGAPKPNQIPPRSDQNLKWGTSRRTLKTQLSLAIAEWKAQIKTGNHVLPTNMLCSWLTCQLRKNPPLYKQLSHSRCWVLSWSSMWMFSTKPSPGPLLWNPGQAFLLIWWLAFLINDYRRCWALHGLPSSFCFPETCLWKKPAPEAKQRRSLKFPTLYPSSYS